VHVFAGASKYLAPRDGRQGLDAVDQVAESLKVILAGGLRRARASSEAIAFRNVELAGEPGGVDLMLRKIVGRTTAVPHYLVSFASARAGAATPRIVLA
jgi:hypothetical protein